MVHRPRLVSRTGCLSCRLRKTKCDEARPGCSTCARLGRECLYPERDPEQFGREAEAHRVRLRTARTKVPVDMKAAAAALGRPSSTMTAVRLPGDMGLKGFSDQICIAFTLHALFKGFNRPVKTNYDTSALTVQTEIAFTERGSSKSWLCLSALGVTFYALAHKDGAVLRKGRDLHTRAIQVMQAAIQDPAERGAVDTLAAMVFLTNFSNLRPLPNANWSHYIHVLTNMVKSVGPGAFSTAPRRFILENNRLAMIHSASIRREPCFLNEPAWKEIPWRSDPAAKDDYQRLLDVYTEIPALEAAVDALTSTGDPREMAEGRARISRWLLDIQNKLHVWRLSIEPVHTSTMATSHLRDFAALEFQMVRALEFGSTQTALCIVIFNLVLLVLHQYNSALGLGSFLRPDDWVAEGGVVEGEGGGDDDGAVVGATASLFQSGDAVSMDSWQRPPALRADAVLDSRTLDRAVAASDEICACVPWILDKSGYGVGSLYLLGGLQVAIQAVGDHEPERAGWMRRVLGAIQSTWNGHGTWTMLQC